MTLLFGTAGIPHSAKKPDTLAGLERIKELGLDAMELEFVQGVRMGETLAKQIGAKRQELGLTLTVHAPYFINLNAKEPEKIVASQQRIYDSCRIGALCGAINVTFHAGFYTCAVPLQRDTAQYTRPQPAEAGRPERQRCLGDEPEQTFQTIKKNMQVIIDRLKQEKIAIRLTPELTGKATQFGSHEELIRLAQELPEIGMCIDFSHLHARPAHKSDCGHETESRAEKQFMCGGQYNSYEEFSGVLKQVSKGLGKEFLQRLQMHVSGIKYSAKGEREHLDLQDSDMNYQALLQALKDQQVSGVLICESPNLETDALMLKQFYSQ